MPTLTNLTLRKPVIDGFTDVIEKSNVKAHSRVSKTGKTVQVQQYSDKRQKKNGAASMKRPPMKKQNPVVQQQQDQQQDLQQQAKSKTAPLEKEREHIQYMMDKYPHLIDHKKVVARMKEIQDALHTIDDTVQSVQLSKHGIKPDGSSSRGPDLHEHLKAAREKRLANIAERKKNPDWEWSKKENPDTGQKTFEYRPKKKEEVPVPEKKEKPSYMDKLKTRAEKNSPYVKMHEEAKKKARKKKTASGSK